MGIEVLIIILPVLVLSIIVHEVSHAWMALRCGDDTAYRLGRITLNPMRHLDLMGSLIVPAILVLSHAPLIFAWAKPVPINPLLFNEPRRDTLLVSLAGPVSNLLLALAASLFIRFANVFSSVPFSSGALYYDIAYFVIFINSVLAVFNLLPIPPLDGSKILAYFMPAKMAYHYERSGRVGFIIVILLMVSFLGKALFFIVMLITNTLLMGIK